VRVNQAVHTQHPPLNTYGVMMKALVISPQPFFSPRGTPFSVYYRTLITAELKVQVDLLTYGEGQDVEIPGVRIIRIPHFPFLGSVKVGPSHLKLFLDAFMFLWTFALLLRNRYHFVHAHEEAVFFCKILKPIFRFKLVYDMHSSLPQQLTNFQFTTSKTIIEIFKKLEDGCLHGSDAVITICPDLFDYVNGLISDKGKHVLIENSIFEPINMKRNSSRQELGNSSQDPDESLPVLPEGKRFITYAGTLEPYQGIDILIEAFRRVVAEVPNAFLLIAGGTSDQVRQYSSLANKCGVGSHVLFTGNIPPAHARYLNKSASVLVSPRSAGTNTPLKIYEQLASEVPLVATAIHSHTQILNDDVAILVQPNPDDMARGLLWALNSNGESRRIAANAKRLYEREYSRDAYKKKMKRLLEVLG
jgi:glycosyltransferase involved in cell wall biosynthesis